LNGTKKIPDWMTDLCRLVDKEGLTVAQAAVRVGRSPRQARHVLKELADRQGFDRKSAAKATRD